MNRRTFLAVTGTATIGTGAGCLGGDDAGPANEYGYETLTVDGTDVPLAPVDDVYEWYEDDEASFGDARGRAQYEAVRIENAVFSPAPNGVENDPLEDLSTGTQIVTYCGCPHHLSSQRAASLIESGYAHTYAIDEGLGAWIERGYPLAGSEVAVDRTTYEIQGQSDPAYAGEMVTLEQVDADRREAAPIADDGSYTLQLHYGGSTDSRFRVEAPDYTVEGTLADFTGDVVTA